MPVVNLRSFARDGRRIMLPPDVVRVDRPSRWGNPFRIGATTSVDVYGFDRGTEHKLARHEVMALYRRWLDSELVLEPDMLEPLRGHRLACWCTPLPCHADILVEYLERRPRPRLVVEGLPGRMALGLDRLPAAIAETAPAWPPLAEVRSRASESRVRRLRAIR